MLARMLLTPSGPVHSFVLAHHGKFVEPGSRAAGLLPRHLLPAAQCALASALRISNVTLWLVGAPAQPAAAVAAFGKWARAQGGPLHGHTLSLKPHRFHASSTVGRFVVERLGGPTFSARAAAARGWPVYGAFVSDLVRLSSAQVIPRLSHRLGAPLFL